MKLRNLTLLAFTFLIFSCVNEQREVNVSPAGVEATLTSDSELLDLPKGAFATFHGVEPSLKEVNVSFQNFNVSPGKEKIIVIKETGTIIEIPADAFVDEDGNPVTEEVEISFREFHTPAQVLASGIPMRMKGANGETGYMQSAGMYEIQPTEQFKDIRIAEGKEITVSLASYVNDAEYDFWSLENEGSQWQNQGASQALPNKAKTEARKNLKRIEKELAEPAPVKPFRFDPKKPVIDLDINLETYPDLVEMGTVVWQYAGGDPAKDPTKNKDVISTAWDGAEVEPFESGNLWKLTLSKGDKTFSTTVCPSQSGAQFEEAMAEYNAKMKEYDANRMTAEEFKELAMNQADFLRSSQLSGFGIYNYDLMVKDSDNILVNADFDFGVRIPGINKLASVYMLVNNRNVVKYPPEDWNKIRIDPNADTKMVAILPGNRIATISTTEMENMMDNIEANRGKDFTFKFNPQEEYISSIEDLHRVIENLS